MSSALGSPVTGSKIVCLADAFLLSAAVSFSLSIFCFDFSASLLAFCCCALTSLSISAVLRRSTSLGSGASPDFVTR